MNLSLQLSICFFQAMTVTTSCFREPKNMGHSPLLECLEPFIAVVNLYNQGYDSDHFMLERTKTYGLQSPIRMFRPLIAVVNLFLLGYDLDDFLLERTINYGLHSPVKMFRTSHCGCQLVSSRL